jgi:hypothetical protein
VDPLRSVEGGEVEPCVHRNTGRGGGTMYGQKYLMDTFRSVEGGEVEPCVHRNTGRLCAHEMRPIPRQSPRGNVSKKRPVIEVKET